MNGEHLGVIGSSDEGSAGLEKLVEQWSEESRTTRFTKLLGNSRLIRTFSLEEQWSQRSIVLKRRRAGRTSSVAVN
jgi:hypothetical protein